MYKWLLVLLLLPSMAVGQFSSDSYDQTDPTSSGWGDISQAPFKIRGQNDSTYLSFNPLDIENDTYPILMRIGLRAQRVGDSRTGILVSDTLSLDGNATESQAIYGINLYYGDGVANDQIDGAGSQMGIHGIAQGLPTTNDTLAALVGVQGFGLFVGTGGYITNILGGSFTGQSAASATGNIGGLIGVRGNVINAGDGTISQANSFRGIAPTNTGGGSITWARTMYLEQPSSGSSENTALMIVDPTTGAGADNLVFSFRDSSATNRNLTYVQRSALFTIGKPLYKINADPDSIYVTKNYADNTGAGETNILSDSGTYNGTSGFGLAGGKQGVVLNVKGLIEGANITITTSADSALIIAGPAAGGTADSIGIDTSGSGDFAILYSTTAGMAAAFREGAGIDFTVDKDTVYTAATLGTDIISSEIVDQEIIKDDVDTTSDFVFAGVYKGTSATPGFELVTGLEVAESSVAKTDSGTWDKVVTNIMFEGSTSLGNISDSSETDSAVATINYAKVAAGDSLTIALRLAGGTMAGDIAMNGNNITGGDVVSVDTVIIGADTLVSEDIPAHELRMIVHNASGVTLSKGTPVYISGATGDIPNIDSATADNAAAMPARGIVQNDIANGGDGHIVVAGGIQKLNTSIYSVHDELYIAATGGFTTTKPTGTNLIQKIGEVTRINVNNGEIEIGGAGRTNDIPNIASANFWLGNASAVPTAVTMSSDATMDNAGAVTVADSAITYGKIDHSDVEGNWLDATYEGVLTNSAGLAAALSDETGAALVVFNENATMDTVTLESNVTAESLDVAGELEIPNGANPTTDAEGEIAWDSNDDAIEVYSGDEGESVLIPIYRRISLLIPQPDSLQARSDTICIFHADALMYPFGVEVDQLSMLLEADAIDTVTFLEFSGADPPVFQNLIDTVYTGASDSYAENGSPNDGNLDADDRIFMVLRDIDVPSIFINIIYHVTEGN